MRMNQGKINDKDFFVSGITDCLDYVRKYMGDDFYHTFHTYIEEREEQLTAQIEDAEEEIDNHENYVDSLEERIADLEETVDELEIEINELKREEL